MKYTTLAIILTFLSSTAYAQYDQGGMTPWEQQQVEQGMGQPLSHEDAQNIGGWAMQQREQEQHSMPDQPPNNYTPPPQPEAEHANGY